MKQLKRIALAVIVILALGLVGRPIAVVAGETGAANSAPALSIQAEGKGPGNDKGKGNDDKSKDDKGKKDDKGNKGNANNGSNNGNGNGNAGNAGVNANPPGRGLGAWWRSLRARWFGSPGEDTGGWQLGRFKDAFPFAYPQGWEARERGDALVLTGPWQGGDFIFQMTRAIQVDYDSLRGWVEGDLSRLGIAAGNARFADAGRVQVAVVTGVKDLAYDCPVAYVYLWTQNPAGNNQRQAMGVIAQAPGSSCNAAALNGFVDQYLARLGAGQQPLPLVTPTAPASPAPASPAPTMTPMATATPGQTGWQQTRFFNAFSFAYPPGWSMDRLGDTAHLQGSLDGRAYVMDVVWVRNAPQSGLEGWVTADLADLGAEGSATADTVRQGDAQIAIVPNVRLPGYACPVVRFYVIADNPAGDGPRAFSGTLAQANGQACDPVALQNLAYQMLRQA